MTFVVSCQFAFHPLCPSGICTLLKKWSLSASVSLSEVIMPVLVGQAVLYTKAIQLNATSRCPAQDQVTVVSIEQP